MEMVDLRYASGTTLGGKELLLGVSLNNNPTVSDIYNSTIVDLAHQVQLRPPSLIIVGAVVKLREKLARYRSGNLSEKK